MEGVVDILEWQGESGMRGLYTCIAITTNQGVVYMMEWHGSSGREGVVCILEWQGGYSSGVYIHTGMASPRNEVACDLANKTCWSNFFHTGYIQVSEIQ